MQLKRPARVIIALSGQEPTEAFVFLSYDERLTDLLNDARAFIPVKREDGSINLIAKSSISWMTETPELDESASTETVADEAQESDCILQSAAPNLTPFRPRRTTDPYEVLGAPPGATIAEVRRAYKARIKAVLPDMLAGLDADLERAAVLAAQKVNHAYQSIMRELKEPITPAGDAA
ncbi:MAG TPA: J domain-containing protein [Parvularculaceae bacterium]|nr:J domain-containing protein [Parvularculaceae bacterium]